MKNLDPKAISEATQKVIERVRKNSAELKEVRDLNTRALQRKAEAKEHLAKVREEIAEIERRAAETPDYTAQVLSGEIGLDVLDELTNTESTELQERQRQLRRKESILLSLCSELQEEASRCRGKTDTLREIIGKDRLTIFAELSKIQLQGIDWSNHDTTALLWYFAAATGVSLTHRLESAGVDAAEALPAVKAAEQQLLKSAGLKDLCAAEA